MAHETRPHDRQGPSEVGDLACLEAVNLLGGLSSDALQESAGVDIRLRKSHRGVGEVLRRVLWQHARA
eukprot:CAMPEP_0180668894 /NCGR_PEP_ID=MMETSP1037_2-20121125/63180_1 /TAXON_ID=632150 /ORGANISM="Azadinium spinosum, Strain 3D9" /LENGTH=67 /DNA_ID=CAMNT_0022697677 /DNA_START=155 /DNA_END=354 /DNA_ORIENTATION=-